MKFFSFFSGTEREKKSQLNLCNTSSKIKNAIPFVLNGDWRRTENKNDEVLAKKTQRSPLSFPLYIQSTRSLTIFFYLFIYLLFLFLLIYIETLSTLVLYLLKKKKKINGERREREVAMATDR